jgi:hypothetical protein
MKTLKTIGLVVSGFVALVVLNILVIEGYQSHLLWESHDAGDRYLLQQELARAYVNAHLSQICDKEIVEVCSVSGYTTVAETCELPSATRTCSEDGKSWGECIPLYPSMKWGEYIGSLCNPGQKVSCPCLGRHPKEVVAGEQVCTQNGTSFGLCACPVQYSFIDL